MLYTMSQLDNLFVLSGYESEFDYEVYRIIVYAMFTWNSTFTYISANVKFNIFTQVP